MDNAPALVTTDARGRLRYLVISGLYEGIAFLARDDARAARRIGQQVEITFNPDDQFAQMREGA